MRGSRKFCQRGSNFDNVFYSWWEEPNATISGPSSARQRNAIKWSDYGPTLNASLLALWLFRGSVLLRNPIFLWFFRGGGGVGGGGPPVSPSWSAYVSDGSVLLEEARICWYKKTFQFVCKFKDFPLKHDTTVVLFQTVASLYCIILKHNTKATYKILNLFNFAQVSNFEYYLH